MNVPPEEERFARNANIMAQLVHETVVQLNQAGYRTISPDLVSLAATIISGIEKHSLIQGFIGSSHHKCWDRIKVRDELFFVENASDIFSILPIEKVNLFKDLFLTTDANGNSVMPRALKDQLWDLFDTMVKISIKYVHKGRNPYSYATPEGVANAYAVSFMDDVDMAHHAPIWHIELDFPLKC
jgi:hypothetical protein